MTEATGGHAPPFTPSGRQAPSAEPALGAATATACAWSPGDGYNWTDRYPWIVEAACKVRQKQFVLDGEAVIFPTAEGLPCKQTRAY